jgi:hypothetical protein
MYCLKGLITKGLTDSKGYEMPYTTNHDNDKKHANVIAECERNRQNKLQLSTAWIDFTHNNEPRYLITITFKDGAFEINGRKVKYDISDRRAVKLLKKLMHFVNCSLFRRRYARGEEFLEGFVAIEYQQNGNPHFHMLITNDIPIDRLEAIFKKHLGKIVLDPNYTLSSQYHPLSELGFDITDVYSDGAAFYIRKDSGDPVSLEALGYMNRHETYLLTDDGIEMY